MFSMKIKHVLHELPKSYILESVIPPFCNVCNKYIKTLNCNNKPSPNTCPFYKATSIEQNQKKST